MERVMSVVEAKVCNCAYVGFSIVGISKVMPKPASSTFFTIRDYADWITEYDFETVTLYENFVGYSQVGYSRVSSEDLLTMPELADWLEEDILEERLWKGVIAMSPEQAFYPRIFFWKKVDKLHWTGGAHQLRMQELTQKVKQILDKEGIIAQFRISYLNFAHELFYLKHEGHRYYKQYKLILTEDDLIDKYKRLGLDETILRRIKNIIWV